MGNMSESKTPTAESMSSITVETVDQTTPLITVTMAASLQTSRKLTTINTSTPVDSPPAPATEDESATPPLVRLIDSDPSKFRSLKRVIVIGHPGSGTDGVGDALTKLGFKVDNFQAASGRYERHFPLWVEAARLRQEGRPYNKSDYDKLIGDHDAIVGMPACFFGEDIVKLYTGVKVILLTEDSDLETVLRTPTTKFWARFDPVYQGNIERLLKLIKTSIHSTCMSNDRAIRDHGRVKNLLEVRNLLAWTPLCEFLQVQVPDAPAPTLHDDRARAELAARPWRALSEQANKAGQRLVTGLTWALAMASITLIAVMAAVLGGNGLYRVSYAEPQLFLSLVARSRIRDTTRGAAAGFAFFTFVCGIGTGYGIALMRMSEPAVVESPARDHRPRNNNGRRKAGNGRSRQSKIDGNRRPERPTLDGWSGVQENIRKDDVNVVKEGRASFEEQKNGKHVTFHVTHKQTESGQDLRNGSRNVLLVTKRRWDRVWC